MPPKAAPVVIDLKFNPDEVKAALADAFPGRDVVNRADPAQAGRDLAQARYAVVWKSQPDLFARAPNLAAVFSGGAGVDHVLTLPGLPDVPLVRFVDPTLTTRMSEWVALQCLLHLRQHGRYAEQAQRGAWAELPQPEARDLTVGVMGLGVLGQDAARKLQTLGFTVTGWSRRKKTLNGIETYDESGLDAFLARTDILVGLLPLTAETRGLYDATLFAKLSRKGPFGAPVFINAGRGGSQVEADIIAALRSGGLHGASLDVFSTEPLEADSPLWTLPNCIVTPHAAAASDVKALFRQVEAQIERHEAGLPFEHLVDRTAGY
ncbi:glyoxylate/hydroxypyruvate reductase A [Rhizobium sp. Leaf371]|uniref:2-hydroxyacid dehydrogenase n=1 Tax=Rhizobium sp. Leaf371 TaxID=1736355 RepID=UPI0007134CF2|nr:glyoxylate/hydroxypyruvate reductase A [Rhizobium sp. Leaf371]KQS65498.1 glyoxylate/hydroxypyruvate reductase A [Rhizobium sp. Leaf371]